MVGDCGEIGVVTEQSKLPFPFNGLTDLLKLISGECLTELQDVKSDIFKPHVMVSPGEVMTHWVFHLFSSDGGKVVDHAIHQSALGLTNIVHATAGAPNCIDEVVGSAGDRHPRPELPIICIAFNGTTGVQTGAIFTPSWRRTLSVFGTLA